MHIPDFQLEMGPREMWKWSPFPTGNGLLEMGNLTKPRRSQQFRYWVGYAPTLAKPHHLSPQVRGFLLTNVDLIRGEPLVY